MDKLIRGTKRCIFNNHTLNVLLYIILITFSSYSVYLACLVNVGLFLYIFLAVYAQQSGRFATYLITSSMGNFITFEVMVQSYAELLVWEHVLHIFFYVLAYLFFYLSIRMSNNSNRVRPFFDFKSNAFVKYKLFDESDEDLDYFKSIFFLLIASIYSSQLTFSTMCTPYMIFDWFLVIKDCSLVYSNFFSSVSMTCGLFCVNTSLTCIPLLVKLFRKIRNNLEKEEVFIIR